MVCSNDHTGQTASVGRGAPHFVHSPPVLSGYPSPPPEMTDNARTEGRGHGTDLAHHSGGGVAEEIVAHGETVAALHVLHDQSPLGPKHSRKYFIFDLNPKKSNRFACWKTS